MVSFIGWIRILSHLMVRFLLFYFNLIHFLKNNIFVWIEIHFVASLDISEVDNTFKCYGPSRCGVNNFCVGFEYDRVFCYGSNQDCLWNSNDCVQDSDCSKYTTSSFKYSTMDPQECNIGTMQGWEKDACKCKKGQYHIKICLTL